MIKKSSLFFSEKFLNIVCFALSICYAVYALCFVFIDFYEAKKIENDFLNLISYTAKVNADIQNKKILGNLNNSTEENKVEPLFTDGKTAILTTYEEFYNAKSFYIEVAGSMSTELMGISVKAGMDYKAIKFNENKKYYSNYSYLKETSASAMLLPAIESSVNLGRKILKENNSVSYYETSKITNNEPNYSGCSKKTDNSIEILTDNLPIINEKSINKISYFKIKEKAKVPVFYYVQAELNTDVAFKDYAKYMKYDAGCIDLPQYHSATITACIDSLGKLIGFNLNLKATIYRDTPIGAKYCPCIMNLSYSINGINEQINYNLEGF